jgi:nucleoside-diphosphate-sugar epimerase
MFLLMNQRFDRVLVTGGGGYIGSVLVARLLETGRKVAVLDRFFFGKDVVDAAHPNITVLPADIRDETYIDGLLARERYDAVIHLAAVSNDPCSEIDAELTRAINRVALEQLMRASKRHGVSRFLYASSASVYGVKSEPNVHEDLSLEPITLYARYKAEGEDVLNALVDASFTGVSVRPGTVCGWSRRLRLDLTVNLLTFQALMARRLTVWGGPQMRPNVHVDDMADFYVHLLEAPADRIRGRAFNVCNSNASVMELAEMVRDAVDAKIPIEVTPTPDPRSYRLSGERARLELGYEPKRHLSDAVAALVAAYADGRVRDPKDLRYRNVELMRARPEEWASSRPL